MIGDRLSHWAIVASDRIRDRHISNRSIAHPITHSPITQSTMVPLLLCALSAACGASGYTRDDPSKTHVGIVYDIGGKDDRSFNAAAWRGVHCAETGQFPDGTGCGKPALGIVVRDV